MLLSVGSGSNVALDMFPSRSKGGLEAWKKSKPLGAAWDTEERRADVLSFDPDGKNEKIVATGLRNCSGHGRSSRPPARSGASSTSATSSATTCRSNTPPRSRKAPSTAGPGTTSARHEDPRQKGERPDLEGQGHRSRRADAGAFGAAADRLLRGRRFPGRVQGQRLRHPARLVEPRRSAPATRWCGCCSRTASRPANTRIS